LVENDFFFVDLAKAFDVLGFQNDGGVWAMGHQVILSMAAHPG
jgi:hypothetical protein